MKRLSKALLAVFLTASLSFLITLPAGAQEEEEKDEVFELEEVTVTAEKRSENLQDVARSVIAIGVEDLNLRSADQVQEMIENQAGISFVGGGSWLNHIGMRGVIPNTAETGTEASVQFSIDGNVALSSENSISPMFAAMNDVERVEVIRGPSGSVSGRMAAAGAVRVITKSPTFEKYDGYVGYTIGNYDTRNTKAALNVPLSATGFDLPSYLENIAVRLAIRQDKHSEYIHNSEGQGVSGDTDFLTWRTKLKWEPFKDLSIDLQMSYNRDKSNNQMTVPLIEDGDNPHKTDPWLNADGAEATEPSESIQWNEAATVNWSTGLGDVTGRYSHSWIPVDCDSGSAGPPGSVCYEGEIGQKEYELYIASPVNSKWTWMVGGYMFNKKEYAGPDEEAAGLDYDKLNDNTLVQFGDFYYSGGGPPGSSNYWTDNGFDTSSSSFPANDQSYWPDEILGLGGEVTPDSVAYVKDDKTRPIDSYAYYANLTIPVFGDAQRFTLGFRHNIEKKKREVSYAIIGLDEGETEPHFTWVADENDPSKGTWYCDNCHDVLYEQDPVTYDTDNSVFNYTIGYEYDLRDEVMLYANVNNGFKPGGISTNSVPNVEYDPEESMNYAIGTRSRWFDNRVQFNVEAYLMTYDGYQINIASEGELSNEIDGVVYTQPYKFQSRTMNMGSTNIYGLELDYDWMITSADRLKGNFEYKHAEYGELDIDRGKTANPPGSAQFFSYGGRVMQNAPKYSFYASYSHTFTFTNILVTPTFDGKYVSKYFCNSEPWYEVVAPNEIWQDAYFKFNAFLNITPTDGNWSINIYGKNLTETVIRNYVGGNANIEAPRTYGVGLTVNF